MPHSVQGNSYCVDNFGLAQHRNMNLCVSFRWVGLASYYVCVSMCMSVHTAVWAVFRLIIDLDWLALSYSAKGLSE